MKLKIILIFIIVLLSAVLVKAEWIRTDKINSVKIQHIMEIDRVEGVDLYVTIAIQFWVMEGINNFTFYFNPIEVPNSQPARDIKAIICRGTISGTNYEDIRLNCGEKINFSPSVRIRWDEFKEYEFFVDHSKINKSIRYVLYIKYVIPNYIIKTGTNNHLWLRTICSGGIKSGSCPSPTMIYKYIMLPRGAIMESLPQNSKYKYFKDRPIIILEDFTPQDLNTDQYDEKHIFYRILAEEEEKTRRSYWKGIWTALGISIFAGILVNILWLYWVIKPFDKKRDEQLIDFIKKEIIPILKGRNKKKSRKK